MKNLLTIFGLFLATTVLASPLVCRPTIQECLDFGKTLQDSQKSNTFCYAQPQSFCDQKMTQHKSTEEQKYELREGRQAPADLMTATTSEVKLGNSQSGNIQVLPVIGGFSIMAALVVSLFIKYRK